MKETEMILNKFVDEKGYDLEELDAYCEEHFGKSAFCVAFQLTAYEQWGMINFDGYALDAYEVDFSVENYNEYLIENSYEPYYEFDEETLNSMDISSWDVMTKTAFGRVCVSDEYFTYDGYGNFETISESHLMDKARCDDDFVEWHMRENTFIFDNEDVIDELKAMALELVKEGY